MGRSSLGVLAGALLVILFSLLAGWTSYIPSEIAMWLPLIGFLSGCAVIGLVSRLRTAHTILVSFVVFISTVILLTFINMSWMGVFLGPFDLGAIYNAWIAFQTAVFSFIPPSTSIGIDKFLFLTSSDRALILIRVSGKNDCPPKPGFTDITNTK